MKKDRLIGLIALVLGIAALACTMMIQTPVNAASSTEPGPRLFPMIASVLLIVCGLGLIFQKQKDYEPYLTKEQWIRLGALLAAFILYCAGLHFLGFVAATPIMLFTAMTMFLGGQKLSPVIRVVYSVGVTAVIYVVFVIVLKTNIPLGMLAQLF